MTAEKRKRLGDFLVELGLVKDYELSSALEDQKQFGGKIGLHLVRMGSLAEEKLIDVLAHQLNVPRINLQNSHIRLEALELVRKDFCLEHRLIPVSKKTKGGMSRILVAMADPTDMEAVNAVEFASGCRITLAIAPETDIRRAIEFCFSEDGLRECIGQRDLKERITLELETGEEGKKEDFIVLHDDGEEGGLKDFNNRAELALRVLLDLLIEKKIITADEFHTVLKKLES